MNPAEYDRMAAFEREHWWYRGLRDLISRVLRRFRTGRVRPLAVLDAGCGTGENLRWLNEILLPDYLGGFDVSPLALEHAARKNPGADLYVSDICNPELHVAELDVITSCDVVDVPGAVSALPGLRRLAGGLRPGGLLILNVPAFNWLRSRHDLAVRSSQRFSARQVGHLLHEAGLSAELVTYRVWTVFPAIVLARLPSIIRPPSDAASACSDVAFPNFGINGLLSSVLSIENRGIAAGFRLPWGSSVFAVGRKPESGGCAKRGRPA